MITQANPTQTLHQLNNMIRYNLIISIFLFLTGCGIHSNPKKMIKNLCLFKNIETKKFDRFLNNSNLDSCLSKKYNDAIYKFKEGYIIRRDYYSQFFKNRENLIDYLEKIKSLEIEQVKELEFQNVNFNDDFFISFIEIGDSLIKQFNLKNRNISELDHNLNQISIELRWDRRRQITAYIGELIIEKNTNSSWLRQVNSSKNQFTSPVIVIEGINGNKIVEVYEIVKVELKNDRVQFSQNPLLRNILY